MITKQGIVEKYVTLFCLCLVFVGLCGCDINNGDKINIAALSIEQGQSQCSMISFDEAVKLRAELHGMNSDIEESNGQLLSDAEQELLKIEDEVKENGGQVVYYEFSGKFSVSEIEELQGVMTTLVVVVEGEETTSHASRYIQLVEKPITKAASQTEKFSWSHGESSADIDTYKEKALLSAVGYIVAEIPIDNASIQYSNNLQIDFEFSTDML